MKLRSASIRCLVLSIGGSIRGEDPDLKFDFNPKYLLERPADVASAIERLACEHGIDPEPYHQMWTALADTVPARCSPVHDFIGVGGGRHGFRLNVYLRISAPTDN